MKSKFKKREHYIAPRMEAASFRTESGYATSGVTQQFNDVAIDFGS